MRRACRLQTNGMGCGCCRSTHAYPRYAAWDHHNLFGSTRTLRFARAPFAPHIRALRRPARHSSRAAFTKHTACAATPLCARLSRRAAHFRTGAKTSAGSVLPVTWWLSLGGDCWLYINAHNAAMNFSLHCIVFSMYSDLLQAYRTQTSSSPHCPSTHTTTTCPASRQPPHLGISHTSWDEYVRGCRRCLLLTSHKPSCK